MTFEIDSQKDLGQSMDQTNVSIEISNQSVT